MNLIMTGIFLYKENLTENNVEGLFSISNYIALIGALSALVQAVVMLFAAIYALKQLRELEKTRRSQIGFYFLERLNDVESRKRRYRIYKISKKISRSGSSTSKRDEESLGLVANEFHALGYMVECGFIDKILVLRLYYGTITRLWNIMSPWIEQQRVKRGTKYAEYFEILADYSSAYIKTSRRSESVRVFR